MELDKLKFNPNNRKNIIIKNCVPVTNCISEINDTQIDKAKDIDIVMPSYNLIKYSNNYSGSLWKYYGDESFLNANDDIADFPFDINNSASFKVETKLANRVGSNGRRDFKIGVPLKYLNNFLRTLEIPLINCEINLILTWSARCFIIDDPVASLEPTFTTTDTILYISVLTLSTQDNAKLFEQLK